MRKFAALKSLIEACDTLVDDLKRKDDNLKGIYERSDAMYAIYPGNGSRFARHIDNTTQDGRRLTLLVYLNPDWTKDLGGALRLTTRLLSNRIEDQGGLDMNSLEIEVDEIGSSESSASGKKNIPSLNTQKSSGEFKSNAPENAQGMGKGQGKGQGKAGFIDVYPQAGRLAMFYSSEIAHEVLATYGERFAVTVWYYDIEERESAVKMAGKTGRALETAKSGAGAQSEAKKFIALLMGGDEIGPDGGNPTSEELSILSEKVIQILLS